MRNVNKTLRKTTGLETVKRIERSTVRLWKMRNWTLWRGRPPPKQKIKNWALWKDQPPPKQGGPYYQHQHKKSQICGSKHLDDGEIWTNWNLIREPLGMSWP
jgi:hypothetical protein